MSCSCSREHIASAADLTEAHGPLLGRLFAVAAEIARAEGIAEQRLPAHLERRTVRRPVGAAPPRPPDGRPRVRLAAGMTGRPGAGVSARAWEPGCLPRPLRGFGRQRRPKPSSRTASGTSTDGPRPDLVALHLERVRPREVDVRPEPPRRDPRVDRRAWRSPPSPPRRSARRAVGSASARPPPVHDRPGRRRASRRACGQDVRTGARTIASIRPGSRLEDHRVADAGDAQGVLDVLREDVEAVGQDDDVLRAAVQDQPPGRVELARGRRVRYQPSSVNAAAVASGRASSRWKTRRAAEQDLAVLGEPHLDPADSAGRRVPRRWSVHGVAGPGSGLGRAVALHDHDARGPPRPAGADGGRNAAGRDEEAEARRRAARGRCRKRSRRAAVREAAGDPAQRARSSPAGRPWLDLALDRRPEQVEDLGNDDHRGDPVLADRLEDDPRVPAPDVQDVGARGRGVDRARWPARRGARAAGARRSGTPCRRDDPVERRRSTATSWRG